MKRFIALIVALMLCGIAVCSFAAEPDIAKMSDDELLALAKKVTEEVQKRNLIKTEARVLNAGKYVIGEDIAPGKYIITCTKTDSSEGESMMSAFGDMMRDIGKIGGEDNGAKAAGNALGSMYDSLGKMMGDEGIQVEIIGDYGNVQKNMEIKLNESVEITLVEKTALQISNGSCTIEEKK